MNGSGTIRFRTPVHMVWLATNACNARCLHCSSNSTVCTADELSTAEAKDMVDQLADAGVVDLAVSGGEPLLRADIFEILAYATSRAMSVGIGSNGSNLTSAQAGSLKASGINRFQVSLDGFEDTHDRLRQWPGLFRKAIRTVEVAAATGIRVHVCFTITRLNASTLRAFAEFVTTLPVARLNISRYVPTGRGTSDLDLSPDCWKEVIARCVELREELRGKLEITTHLAQHALVDDKSPEIAAFVGCQAGRGQGCITANGTVQPCVLLPIPLGNIRERRFIDIWLQAPVVEQLQCRARLEGPCGNCVVRERCGGCRAVAYASTGNWLESDPRCWLVNKATNTGRVFA